MKETPKISDVSSLLSAKQKITSKKNQVLLKLTEFAFANPYPKASVKFKNTTEASMIFKNQFLPSQKKTNQIL